MSDMVVQGDTGPDVIAVIHEAGNVAAPVDLTDCTVAFQMRKPDDRRFTVNAMATIVGDPVGGRVSYEWRANDLAVAGDYQARFEVRFRSGKVQHTKVPLEIEVSRE